MWHASPRGAGKKMKERTRVLAESLRSLLEEGKTGPVLALLDGLHPSDAADVLGMLNPEERVLLFSIWDAEYSSDVLREMDEEEQLEVVRGLAGDVAARILENMNPDDAADLLGRLPSGAAHEILGTLDPKVAGKLKKLLAHGRETAGGLMTPEAMRLSDELTVGEVLEALRLVPEDVELIYYVYFHDKDQRLSGVCSLRELIMADPDTPVKEIMHTNLVTIGPDESREKVAALIDRYDLLSLPVVDGEGRLLGIITVDDVMEVVEREAKEDIMSLAGTVLERGEGQDLHSLLSTRIPWLAGAFLVEVVLVGSLLRWGSGMMRDHVALIFFIPVVLMLASTLSLQSSSRMLVEIREGSGIGFLLRRRLVLETFLGLAFGTVAGLVIFLLARTLGELSRLGVAVAIAVGITCLLASFLGAALPAFLGALGRDPVKASGPRLISLTDVVGVLIYLLVARLLLAR